MTLFSQLRSWLHSALHRSHTEHAMDAELRFHLESYADDLIRNGIPRDEVLRRARREFGGLERAKEECRDARGITFLESLLQEIRYALRTLRNSPAFTAIAILTLALGIGANTAIFSLIDTVVLRMLPVRNPQEFVQLSRLDPSRGGDSDLYFTNTIWEQVRDHQDVFSSTLAWSNERFDLAQGGAVQNANGVIISGDFFNALGVRPVAGRLLTVADDQRGCPSPPSSVTASGRIISPPPPPPSAPRSLSIIIPSRSLASALLASTDWISAANLISPFPSAPLLSSMEKTLASTLAPGGGLPSWVASSQVSLPNN
jgi:MacB-like periplasmic core domain